MNVASQIESQRSACPGCDIEVALGADTIPDELVECRGCGRELVVLSTDPLVLAEAPQTEQDWGE